MVNVIVIAHAVFQMHIIINRSKNVFLRNVLWNQVVNVTLYQRFQFINVPCTLLKQPFQDRIIHLLCNTHFHWVDIHNSLQVYHHIRKNFNIAGAFLTLYPQKWNGRILDRIGKFSCDHGSCLRNHFPCNCADNLFCQSLSFHTVPE